MFCSAKTAKSKCWNGEVEMNEDGQEFSAEGIRGQGLSTRVYEGRGMGPHGLNVYRKGALFV